jgi:Zn-dependent peptidase ImmA (M78 family)
MLQTGKLWMDRLSQELQGFNQRPFTLDDLHEYCHWHGIFADEVRLRRLHGCCFYQGEMPCLIVNELLSAPEKIVAGYHELAHLILHDIGQEVFCSTGNLWNHAKVERQAQIVGLCALLPRPMLDHDLSEYPRQIVAARRRVWWETGL